MARYRSHRVAFKRQVAQEYLSGEGWLYLAAVLDLATRKIVGWSIRLSLRTVLMSAALMMATQRQRPGAGLICHSDRGSQYAAEAYRKQLADMMATPSMSRTGCCHDNAPMESFFRTLKVERVHQRRWATRDEARRDLFATARKLLVTLNAMLATGTDFDPATTS